MSMPPYHPTVHPTLGVFIAFVSVLDLFRRLPFLPLGFWSYCLDVYVNMIFLPLYFICTVTRAFYI